MLSGCDVKLLLILLTLSRSSCLITNCAKLIFVWLLYYNKISRPLFCTLSWCRVQTKICYLLKPALTTTTKKLNLILIWNWLLCKSQFNGKQSSQLCSDSSRDPKNRKSLLFLPCFWSRIKQFIIPFPERYSLTQKCLFIRFVDTKYNLL